MNSRSNIGNRNLDRLAIESSCRHGNFLRFLIGHRLKCIPDEIDNDLLDLNPVHQYVPGAVIEFKPWTHRHWCDATQYKDTCFLDYRRKCFYSPFRLTPADQLAETADDFARPQCLLGSLVSDFLRGQEIDLTAARKQPLRRIDRIDDRRERLADFVRESGGHLTGGREARCTKKLILQFLKAQIGLLAFKLLREESFIG